MEIKVYKEYKESSLFPDYEYEYESSVHLIFWLHSYVDVFTRKVKTEKATMKDDKFDNNVSIASAPPLTARCIDLFCLSLD